MDPFIDGLGLWKKGERLIFFLPETGYMKQKPSRMLKNEKKKG